VAGRIWKDVLAWGCEKEQRGGFTAGDVETEFSVSYKAAAMLLKRLQSWGMIRMHELERTERPNPHAPGETMGSRPRKVWVVTERGQERSAHLAAAPEPPAPNAGRRRG